MDNEVKVPDWLTDMDKEILEVLSSGLILTPSIISENIGRSRKGVSNRLNSLQAGELIEKVDRGKYRITMQGEAVWGVIDGEEYRKRRLDVTQRKLIRREFGVSMEEYHRIVNEELEKLPNTNINDKDEYEEAIRKATERAEDRLREQASEESSDT